MATKSPKLKLPDLKLYNTTRHVGGSCRRGRNASNAWAADTLAAIQRQATAIHANFVALQRQQGAPSVTEARPEVQGRFGCDTCGRPFVARTVGESTCKGSGRFYEMARRRVLKTVLAPLSPREA